MKIVSVVGARPQFVKASVLRKLFKASDDFDEILVHTGQHYDQDMSDVFFDELKIATPEENLNINGGPQGQMTGRMLESLEKVLLDYEPDACLVYGDTNSTLAGALAASKLHIPVIHIEAGLRSFNKTMPEEINRILTDHVSDLLLCPTQLAVENLRTEGITRNVHMAGDLMYDATLNAIKSIDGSMQTVHGVDLRQDNIAVCTVHRAENTDDASRLKQLIDYLNEQCETYKIILPLHPRTQKALAQHGIDTGDIVLIPPASYIEMQALLASAQMVFTDSGGLQKEAYFHKVPCVTLRSETEWVELIEAGWNRLWTIKEYNPRKNVSEYGTGESGIHILNLIREQIGN